MRLPMQSNPVQRTIASQPFAFRNTGCAADAERGVAPSGCGVHHSSLADLLKGIGYPYDMESFLPIQTGPFAI